MSMHIYVQVRTCTYTYCTYFNFGLPVLSQPLARGEGVSMVLLYHAQGSQTQPQLCMSGVTCSCKQMYMYVRMRMRMCMRMCMDTVLQGIIN